MKIALIGQGAMGQLVAKLAQERNHEVVAAFSSKDGARTTDQLSAELSECEVAIDFSVASAVHRNIELCMLAGHYEMLATTIAALRIEPDRRR